MLKSKSLWSVFLYGLLLVSFIFSLHVYYTKRADTFDLGVNRGIITFGSHSIPVTYARTKEERAKGLSGKERLSNGEGLFFVFPEKDFHGIWMKDMLFPIDILWLDNSFRIVFFEKNVPPESFPEIFRPTKSSKYVLEVYAGTLDRYKIKVGDQGILKN